MTTVQDYMKAAGFPASTFATGSAIVMAESGGNALAVNNSNNNGSSDYGLWQINSVHAALLAKYNWRNPQQNTDMAYQIWKSAGNNWSPWATFNNGSYKQYLTGSTSVSGDSSGATLPDANNNNASALNIATEPNSYYRIGLFVVGLALLLIGGYFLMSSTNAFSGTAKAVKKAVA